MERFIQTLALLASIIMLVLAWVTIGLAVKEVYFAISNHGLSISTIVLNANAGYFGLFSFGLSSIAIILASSSPVEDLLCNFIAVYRLTLFVALILFIPVVVTNGMVVILMEGL